jgi:hypothetical protein
MDSRIARKQAGGMRIGPYATMHNVEARELAAAKFKEPAHVPHIAPYSFVGGELPPNTVYICRRDAGRPDQRLIGEPEIALRIARQDQALIDPKNMYMRPPKSHHSEALKQKPRRGST